MFMDCKLYYDTLGKTGISERELNRFEKTMPYVLKKGTLCDVGCGEGYWLEYLNQNTELTLFGTDISTERLKQAKENSKIRIMNADIRNLPFKDNEIEQITAMEILEHIPDWKKGLEELIRVASKRIIITIPYNEKLKYEICPKCGERAYLYGHMHSFKEKDFKSLDIDKIEFFKFPGGAKVSYYIKKLLNIKKGQIHTNTQRTICPQCYTNIPYSLKRKFERGFRRINKILEKSPEYLVIKIDK